MGHNHTSQPAAASGLELLSHELGNVMNGISGMIRLLRSSGLTPEQQQWLHAIELSGQQMKRLAEFTACVSSADALSARPVLSGFDGMELLEQLVFAHTPSALANGNRLILQVEPGLETTWTSNRSMLNQLLDNLLGNALKYSAGGDVIVAARAGRNGELRLSVQDSGPGISDREVLRVFEPYYRVSEACPGRPGQGLGLFICRRIVDALGGAIGISRAAGGGACVSVEVPGAMAPGKAAVTHSAALEEFHCVLSLDPELMRSVGWLLDRLGVSWSDAQTVGAPTPCGTTTVLVFTDSDPGRVVMALCDASGRPDKRCTVLLAPVLETTLEPALLRLALEHHWALLSACDKPG